MAGHLFVVHGDLRTLYCDHWLLPVDSGLGASRSFSDSAAWRALQGKLPRRMPEGQRVLEVPDWPGGPRPWPTNVASGRKTPALWQATSVRAFLEAAAAAPATLPDRHRPLLALPVVGTGWGGKRRHAGEVLRAVIPEIYAFLADSDVDVALVTWTEEDFAAAQATRRRCIDDGLRVWPDELTGALRERAVELARLASRQRLVVFMGAGVSASVGLPTWSELLERLAERAGFSETERTGLRRLGHLDRAQLIARRLGPDDAALGRAVRASLDVGGAVSLSHVLVAGLPVKEFITTNYDDCFERACDNIGRGVARLPYAPASGAQRWLLKMHGCVRAPEDIVLTRQDYVRYAERSAALAGIVQAMLITRHMLFVGFSLDDDNFHRIVDAVRRALVGARRDRLGTVIALFANPLVEQLWSEDLEWLHMLDEPVTGGGSPDALARAARRFEVFLDHLSFHATAPHHLLNPRFGAVLTREERDLAAVLGGVRDWMRVHGEPDPSAPVASAWAWVQELLWELGDRDA